MGTNSKRHGIFLKFNIKIATNILHKNYFKYLFSSKCLFLFCFQTNLQKIFNQLFYFQNYSISKRIVFKINVLTN